MESLGTACGQLGMRWCHPPAVSRYSSQGLTLLMPFHVLERGLESRAGRQECALTLRLLCSSKSLRFAALLQFLGSLGKIPFLLSFPCLTSLILSLSFCFPVFMYH